MASQLPTRKCAVCGRAITGDASSPNSHGAFCSDRCRTIDLGRWFGEQYHVPAPADTANSETRVDGDDEAE